MVQNYFFIDGSALLAQIRALQKKKRQFRGRKLDPLLFVSHLSLSLLDLDSAQYKRAVYYFPNGEKAVPDYLQMPDVRKPAIVRDVQFKYCGEKLPKSKGYEGFLQTVPKKWMDRCVKSEKGVDMEICCDGLRLASFGRFERLFLLTNDRDFIPFVKTLKDFGVNVSLVHLSTETTPSDALLQHCDSYDVVKEDDLQKLFFPKPPDPPRAKP